MKQLTLTTAKSITDQRISYLILQKGIDRTIASIDLEMVKLKLMDPEEGLGWTATECDIAEVEYKRFLHLNKKYPDSIIVPNLTMDAMWHQHILDTNAYHLDCDIVFGNYFHHFPYFGMRNESDKQDLLSAFANTIIVYTNEFREGFNNFDSSNC